MNLSSFHRKRGLYGRALFPFLTLGCLLTAGLPADAQKPPGSLEPSQKPKGAQTAPKGKLTLDQAVSIALRNNAEIKERQAGVLGAEATKSRADAARYPSFEALVVLGPSPRARGDQLASPDNQRNPTISGVFTRGIFSLVQPIFTFGEISGFRQAASSNIKVEKAKVDEKASEVIVKVKEFYYGNLLAKDLLSLVEEVKEQLEDAKKKVRKLLEKDSDTVEETDLYKLEAFTSTVENGLNQAKKSVVLALGALKFTMGLRPEEEIELADSHILPDTKRVANLPYYREQASELRPEFTQIREGLTALQALENVEKSKYFPKFFIAALADIADATNRDEINNPFVIDPLNHDSAGVVVGFKWSLDFGIPGRIGEARAERLKIMEKKAFAEQGIPLQVKKAYEEIQEAAKNIKSTENSYKFARKWLVASVANFDLGVGNAEEIFKALEQYAKTRAENYKQIYAYNMAMARLDETSGLAMKIVRKNEK